MKTFIKTLTFICLQLLFSFTAFSQSETDSLADMMIQENTKGVTMVGDTMVNFQSKRSIFNKKTRFLRMQDDIKIETSNGLSLSTNELNWDQNRDLVLTNKPVKITNSNPQLEITGVGLNVQTESKTLKLKQDLKMVAPQEKAEPVILTCDGPLEVDYEKGEAVFHKNVKVIQETTEIFADLVIMYYDIKNKDLDKVIAKGNVRVIKDGNTSFSKEAVYLAKERKVILMGRPRVVVFPKKTMNKKIDLEFRK